MLAHFLLWHSRLRWLVLLVTMAVTGVGLAGRAQQWSYTTSLRRLTWLSVWTTSLQSVFGLGMHCYYGGYLQAMWKEPSLSFASPQLRFFGWIHGPLMFLAIGLVHFGAARARKTSEDGHSFRWLAVTHGLALTLMLMAFPWERPWWR